MKLEKNMVLSILIWKDFIPEKLFLNILIKKYIIHLIF